MQEREYTNMYNLEMEHWWYQGLDHLIFQIMRTLFLSPHSQILDAGCGSGRILHKLLTAYQAYGIDASADALRLCKQRLSTAHADRLRLGSLAALPYETNQFDLIISADVLYHKGISDDHVALSEFHRVLKPDGKLILNLAALELLRGKHDAEVDTRERYTKSLILQRLENAGFVPMFVTYRLFLLFPFLLASRLMQRMSMKKEYESKSDVFALPGWINRLLYRILWLENQWTRFCPLPIGSSIFVVAKKY